MRTILFLFISIQLVYCAPAMNRERNYIQSDGSSFKAKVKGDEYLHWMEDKEGNILKYNKQSNNYDFAMIEDNQLKASGQAYQKNKTRLRRVPQHISHQSLIKLWELKRVQRGERKRSPKAPAKN